MISKLFFFLILRDTAAREPTAPADCPNSKWELTIDPNGNYCRPKVVFNTDSRVQIFLKIQRLFNYGQIFIYTGADKAQGRRPRLRSILLASVGVRYPQHYSPRPCV